VNVQKAISFVEEKGTAVEKYRLHFLLGKERNDEIPLKYLEGLQKEDGSFPYNDEKNKESCLNATCGNLSLMIELGLGKADVCRKTVNYLFKVQGKDGSWSENEAVKKYNPPFWDMPNDLKTTMWLTAHITNLLIQLGYGKSPGVLKAAKFLLKNRDEEGKFAGFLHSTWITIGVFGQLEGSDSGVVKKALKIIDQNFEKLKDGGGDLAWCLECFYVAGIPKRNPIAEKCIQELVSLQNEDGSWGSADGEKYAVSTTLSVLGVLKKYKVW